MSKREIKLCLVYRDMWQSSGKYTPRVDQLVRVAPAIIEMGCFHRVETNGGGFEQINLLYGENPNRAVRDWTQPFNEVGIQTQMLERGLNGIRMSPVPVDVRKLMFKVKKKQGTDISRSFDGLNDARNIKDSITYAKEGGMIAQAALSITYSPVHTVDYYFNLASELIEHGADEIAIKDMAGIGRPASLGKLVTRIKEKYPQMLVQYHAHSTPGFSAASILEVARAGADIIDVGMEPLAWGTGHADLLTVHAMLKDAGFSLPDINMDAYMHTRSLTQEFIDDFLGYYINPRNRFMNSLLIGPGLPGGMMGSLMSDLENNLVSLNKWLTKRDQPTLTQDDLLIRLFNEVEHIWPKMGYPPLVTPYSQYVKNTALMNVMQMAKGRERWSMVADNTWDMLLGKSGNLPGTIAEELARMAKEQNREFFTGHPQDGYPDELPQFRAEMEKNGWDLGEDEEELMELAMHPQQYRNYKSGKAKADFEADLAERKAAKAGGSSNGQSQTPPVSPSNGQAPAQPKQFTLDINGDKFRVKVSYDDLPETPATEVSQSSPQPSAQPVLAADAKEMLAPLEGTFYLTKEPSEKGIKVGDAIKKGQPIGYIEAMKVFNAITAEYDGVVVELPIANATAIEEDDVIARIQ
ncbi:MAG: biotin/lipoyl-containing protein [Bacteroidota bacterium]